MRRTGVIAGLTLLLCGCIPPSAVIPASAPPVASAEPDAPRIDPQVDATFDQTPVWEMRPVTANAALVDAGTYVVVAGDTLRGIGNRTGAGSEAIARENGLVPPFIIQPGQRLSIPAGRYHMVGTGETGIAIARAYGVSWQAIIAANALEPPYTLRVGQRLRIAPSDVGGEAVIEARAAAFKLDIEDILSGGEPAETEVAVSRPGGAAAKPPAPSSSSASAAPAALPAGGSIKEPARFVGGFDWPADGRVADRFGPAGEGQFNPGINIAVRQGAPVAAAADGVVAFVGNDVATYGGLILVRHGEGWITAYGRATRALVRRGQQVKRGQPMAQAGNGAAPLLFFQIRKGGKPIDPVRELPPR